MPDQPTPKPLTDEEEAAFRNDLDGIDWSATGEAMGAAYVRRLLVTIDSLRAAVAEAEKQRDQANKPWNFRLMLPNPVDTYDAVDCRLVDTGHSDRLLILESGELNERLEELTASRDRLSAELAEARAKTLLEAAALLDRRNDYRDGCDAHNALRTAALTLRDLAARDSAGKASGGGGE